MQEIRWHELADGSKSCKYPGPFHGAQGIPRPLAHLCHIPFLAPQPSLRRALPVFHCCLHRWRGASQPWVSAVRQARAWQGGGGGPGAAILSDCWQGEAAEHGQSGWGVSFGYLLLGICLLSPPSHGPSPRASLKSQQNLLALLCRVLSELKENSEFRQGWPCRIRGDSPKEQAVGKI